jgi:GAF domain-containing protein
MADLGHGGPSAWCHACRFVWHHFGDCSHRVGEVRAAREPTRTGQLINASYRVPRFWPVGAGTPDFLNRFHRMRAEGETACARALACGASVVVRDVEIGREFGSFRRLLRSARIRAVQSTPLRTKDGDSLGVLSTHFVNVHEPTKIEMETLQAYAKEASQYALKLLGETPLATMAAQMSEELYHSIELTASLVRYARSAASSQRRALAG